MLCPKCNVQSEESFCRKCGLDLGVYEELAALKKQLESLQVRLLAPADVPYRAATQAGDGKKEAGSELAKPPPLPPGPAQGEPKDFTPARKSAELAVGQKWFLGIGVLVLIIGIGFFLKYAFDQEWLGPAVQIAVGFVCGACLLFTGGVCHRRELRGLDVGIGAFGLGTLYLSSYAASQVHHLLPGALALVVILIVTLVGSCLSCLWMSQSLAVLTFLGAYLAPLLFASEQFNPWLFLGYLGILAIGGQFLAFGNGWRVFYLIGAVLTWLALLDWTQTFYRRPWFLETFVFTQVLFVAFSLMPFVRSVFKQDVGRASGFVLAVINGLVCCWYSANLLDYQKIPGSLVSLSYAIVCLVIGLLVWQQKRLISSWLIAQGMVFLVVVGAQILSNYWAPVFWSTELVALYWISAKSEDRTLLFGTMIVGLFVFCERFANSIDFIFSSRNSLVFTPDLLPRWVAGLSVATCLLLVSWLDQTKRIHGVHPRFNRMFEALGILSLFGFANFELLRFTTQFIRSLEVVALSVLWTLYAVALLVFGVWLQRKTYRFSAIVLLFVTVLKVLAFDTAEASTPYRILSCMVLGAMLVIVSFLYYRFSERLTGK
jgi:uncharacterized membrane protein